MSTSHKRKKDPEAVRQLLLQVAAGLCLEKGAAGMSLDAVAAAAGVSKGGLLHHFPSKAELMSGLLEDLIARMDSAIHEAMVVDPEPRGRFTRAYVRVCFVPGGMADEGHWKAMAMALLTEPQLRQRWREWVERKAEMHAGTDATLDCEIVHFAVDGLWLSALLESHPMEREREHALVQRLLALSRT